MPSRLDGEKRSRANYRERRRVMEMNKMFDVLLNLLPPSSFKMRLSRAQILREACEYIARLVEYLNQDIPSVTPIELFPHIFDNERQSNKDSYRRPMKLKEGSVHAYISSHELAPAPVDFPPEPPMVQNIYIAYL